MSSAVHSQHAFQQVGNAELTNASAVANTSAFSRHASTDDTEEVTVCGCHMEAKASFTQHYLQCFANTYSVSMCMMGKET